MLFKELSECQHNFQIYVNSQDEEIHVINMLLDLGCYHFDEKCLKYELSETNRKKYPRQLFFDAVGISPKNGTVNYEFTGYMDLKVENPERLWCADTHTPFSKEEVADYYYSLDCSFQFEGDIIDLM